jgi:hypothetical protein
MVGKRQPKKTGNQLIVFDLFYYIFANTVSNTVWSSQLKYSGIRKLIFLNDFNDAN